MHIQRGCVYFVLLVLLFAVSASAQWTWTPQTGRWINQRHMPKETAELQVEYARSLLLKEDYKKAWRETEKFSEFYQDTPFADENQFLRGEIRLAQGKLMMAAKEFQTVLSSYPDTARYNDAIAKQYEIGDLFYEKGLQKLEKRWTLYRHRPLKRAINVYAMVVENQPFTAAAAEAQYKIGLCHYTREEYLEAAYEYRRVIEDYAGSDWVNEAVLGLAKCYYDASLPAVYDQTPSQLAIDAIDSFALRYPEDARNSELQGMREEMRESIAAQRLETARFYEKRRDFEAARIAYQVVVEQFADTSQAEVAQTWLDEQPAHLSIKDRMTQTAGSTQ